MRILLFAFLFVWILPISAQEFIKKNLEVGTYLKINSCKKGKKEFVAIDIYARTNAYNKSKVDTLTGEGLLAEFFKETSIDAKRLPSSMGGKKYKIAALHEFDDNGATKRVVLCYTTYPLTLIWIELDKALELGEITY